jgi:hypothetical protein
MEYTPAGLTVSRGVASSPHGKHCLDLATVVFVSETSIHIKSNQIYISPVAATKLELEQ